MPNSANALDPTAEALDLLSQTMPPKAARIAAAAADVFMDCGFEAASMDEIARRAQVSKATVYAHFKSKAELFEALIQGAAKVRLHGLFDVGSVEDDPAAALEVILERLADYVLSPRALRLYRVVVAEAPRFPELGAGFYRAGPAVVIDRLAQLLATWQAQGRIAIDDPRANAELLYGLARSDLQMRRLLGVEAIPGASETPRANVRRLVAMFLKTHGRTGIGPQEDDP